METLQIFNHRDLKSRLVLRKGEKRLGQEVFLIEKGLDELEHYKNRGAKFCIIGVPECIGPLGNMGRRGAENGFEAFLNSFLNIQSNRFLNGKEIVLAGQVIVDDLMEQVSELDHNSNFFLQKLHVLCEILDGRVEKAVQLIAASGLVPIVIGGGHNNSYPIIKAVAEQSPISVLNIDAHADFRTLEGRHSGNGFSYAFQNAYLNRYAVFGLHQNYNSENMLKAMDAEERVFYSFLEDIQYTDKLFHQHIDFLQKAKTVTGLEIDLDAIRNMPTSAISPSGFSLEQMRYFLRKATEALDPSYLHLAEGAPQNKAEEIRVGKTLTYLVTDFMKTKA